MISKSEIDKLEKEGLRKIENSVKRVGLIG